MIELIVALVIIGVVLWVLNHMLPIDPNIKTIINVVIVLAVCLWLLRAFGVLSGGALRL